MLHPVRETTDSRVVIFIHGVNGHWKQTWLNSRTGFFWPEELSKATGYSTYSLQYDANTNWYGTTMSLQERAASVLDYLQLTPALAGKDLAIVSHSFGGLVSKQIVRRAHDIGGRYERWLRQLGGILFVGTPHGGSSLATYLSLLGSITGATVTVENLRHAEPLLIDLNLWFRNFEDAPRCGVVYEKRSTKVGWFRSATVVDALSSDPGIKGVQPIPVDADHFELCRPGSRGAAQFLAAEDFLRETFAVPARLSRLPRQVAAVCYRSGSNGPEFILVRTTGERRTFPKGGIEPQQPLSESAAAEALQEGGVRGVIESEPFTHYLHAKQEWSDDPRDIKEYCVTAFLLNVTDAAAARPEKNRDPIWVSPEDARLRLSEGRHPEYQAELRRVVDEAVARLAR